VVNNDPKPKMFFQVSSIFGMIEVCMDKDKIINGFCACFMNSIQQRFQRVPAARINYGGMVSIQNEKRIASTSQ
jgi:hypothetical protein